MENTKFTYDVAIIGGGVAGLTAGIYSARAGLKCIIAEKSATGGLATTASNIENYPGIKQTDGFSLAYTMLEQCQSLGVPFIFDEVKDVTQEDGGFTVNFKTSSISAKKIILALGASPRPLNVAGESEFIGKGVSYCATCDGMFYKGKTVAVIGGGNSAAEEALYLSKIAEQVYLVHRRDALRADGILQRRLSDSNVKILWNSTVSNLNGNAKLTEMQLKDTKNGALTAVSVDGVFVAIGQTPADVKVVSPDGVEIKLSKDEHGYILTDDAMRTNVDGIYAVGDVRHKSLRQVLTACSDAAVAADDISRNL